jgi:hypothetical protein
MKTGRYSKAALQLPLTRWITPLRATQICDLIDQARRDVDRVSRSTLLELLRYPSCWGLHSNHKRAGLWEREFCFRDVGLRCFRLRLYVCFEDQAGYKLVNHRLIFEDLNHVPPQVTTL